MTNAWFSFGCAATKEREQKGRLRMLVQCCVCGNVRQGAQWVPVKAADLGSAHVSHGYCPRCAAKAFREIQKRHRKSGYAPSSPV